ncbi:MAG: class I SAM-dependent methyltransferase [Candidatus Sulfotelmatobacter sp.]
MQKVQSDELKGVSETLLIPLHYRVEDSKTDSSVFNDKMAERFHDAISYDWEKFQTANSPLRWVMPVRTRILDDQVGAFIASNPDQLVVNLGAGLDTRFYRLDNATIEWIEIDLPAVITFRRKLREPANQRHWLLPASVLDKDWVAEVKRAGKERVLFVAEGLFPYFTEEEHKKIFACLVDNFPGQEMLFQTSAPSAVKGLVQYSHLAKLRTKVEIQWGLEDSREVSSLNPKVRFVQEFPLIEGREEWLPEELRQKLSSAKIKDIGKIVHVRFD